MYPILVGISINLCKSIQKELFINDTPLSDALKALIFALKDSAAALDGLSGKVVPLLSILIVRSLLIITEEIDASS